MPREKPHYQETLVGIRARAAELYPGQLLFGPTKVAKLLGKSRGWVWQHYGSFRDLNCKPYLLISDIKALEMRCQAMEQIGYDTLWKCAAKELFGWETHGNAEELHTTETR